MIKLKNVKEAQKVVAKVIETTLLTRSPFLSDFIGGNVFLKLENQQITGSFKLRGVYNKPLHLTPDELSHGVVTASAGNHGQAVAYTAKQLGFPATVVLPVGTPKIKIEGVKRYGVKVIMFGSFFDEAEEKARTLAEANGCVFVSAYNDELVVAGHGTVGLEIVEALPTVEAILVPVGGGGLIAGVATAVKALKPKVRIFGVETELSPVMLYSLHAGRIVDFVNPHLDTIAEGLFGGLEKDAITFDIVRQQVDEVLAVKEKTLRRAVRLLWEKDHQRVEGSGAAGVALMLERKEVFEGKTLVVLISGGNIDDALFNSIIAEKD